MKKTAITLAAAMVCSVMSVSAAVSSGSALSPVPVVPVACPVSSPCAQPEQPCVQPQMPCAENQPCPTCGKTDCTCDSAPVFNSCEEIQAWKLKFCEKRAQIYTKLCLSQEQRVKAKCIDDKFFDEIAPLKMCCKQEKAKLKEMECQKCSWSSKRAQKEKIKDLKSEIKDKKNEHKKCFMEILSQCQKDKYKELTKGKDKCGC